MLLLIITESCLLQKKYYESLYVIAASPRTEDDQFAVVVLRTFLFAFLRKLHNLPREDEDHG